MSDAQAHQYHVLMIDDDHSITAVLADGLELLGHYRVTVAYDGIQGLEQVIGMAPDCIIVDIRMPRLNGLQFIRALRGDPATSDIPIIVLSAMVQDIDILKGLLSGADAYLLKPAKLDELIQAVEQARKLTAEQRAQRRDFALDEEGENN
jgi:CheY-like chemotaxis protein